MCPHLELCHMTIGYNQNTGYGPLGSLPTHPTMPRGATLEPEPSWTYLSCHPWLHHVAFCLVHSLAIHDLVAIHDLADSSTWAANGRPYCSLSRPLLVQRQGVSYPRQWTDVRNILLRYMKTSRSAFSTCNNVGATN